MTAKSNNAGIRWAVRATLFLGVAASVVANVLHALDNPISQAIAAWPPLALLITVELISRVPVARRWWSGVRLLATATIAGIAAWVSYWHMVGVALKYGETTGAAHMIPLSVDGLIVVASVCLVELGGRQGGGQEAAPAVAPPVPAVALPAPVPFGQVFDHEHPIGPQPAPPVTAKPAATAAPRRRRAVAQERIEKAAKRRPDATAEELAVAAKVSLRSVQRYRPELVSAE